MSDGRIVVYEGVATYVGFVERWTVSYGLAGVYENGTVQLFYYGIC